MANYRERRECEILFSLYKRGEGRRKKKKKKQEKGMGCARNRYPAPLTPRSGCDPHRPHHRAQLRHMARASFLRAALHGVRWGRDVRRARLLAFMTLGAARRFSLGDDGRRACENAGRAGLTGVVGEKLTTTAVALCEIGPVVGAAVALGVEGPTGSCSAPPPLWLLSVAHEGRSQTTAPSPSPASKKPPESSSS